MIHMTGFVWDGQCGRVFILLCNVRVVIHYCQLLTHQKMIHMTGCVWDGQCVHGFIILCDVHTIRHYWQLVTHHNNMMIVMCASVSGGVEINI